MAAGNHGWAWTRPWRRLVHPFLSAAERARVAEAIARAEAATTGEIRVHILGRTPADILGEARSEFARMGLDKTGQRNAVLILISHLDHRFAIWGDAGIHEAAGQKMWDKAVAILHDQFQERRYCEGLEKCVAEIGRELARRFPRTDGPDTNELSDHVTDS